MQSLFFALQQCWSNIAQLKPCFGILRRAIRPAVFQELSFSETECRDWSRKSQEKPKQRTIHWGRTEVASERAEGSWGVKRVKQNRGKSLFWKNSTLIKLLPPTKYWTTTLEAGTAYRNLHGGEKNWKCFQPRLFQANKPKPRTSPKKWLQYKLLDEKSPWLLRWFALVWFWWIFVLSWCSVVFWRKTSEVK